MSIVGPTTQNCLWIKTFLPVTLFWMFPAFPFGFFVWVMRRLNVDTNTQSQYQHSYHSQCLITQPSCKLQLKKTRPKNPFSHPFITKDQHQTNPSEKRPQGRKLPIAAKAFGPKVAKMCQKTPQLFVMVNVTSGWVSWAFRMCKIWNLQESPDC